MKKFLSLILIIILCCSFSACGSPASSPIEDFEYEFEDGTVTITGYIGTDLEIVIPDTIEKRPVTTIGEEAFKEYDMNTIHIPSTVITIERNAFYGCKLLNKVVFNEGLTDIESHAFEDCELLEDITLPTSLKSVSPQAFSDTKWYNEQNDGVVYNNSLVIDYKGKKPSKITIDDGTTAIVGGDFGGSKYVNPLYSSLNNDGPTDIYIPDSVSFIKEKSIGYISYDNGMDFASTVMTIHGKKGSTAETYANENNIKFAAE